MTNEMKEILRRFMEGTSTIEEEKQLADFFRTNDVEPELQPYKEMFAWFDAGMPEPSVAPAREDAERKPAKHYRIALLAAAAVALLIIAFFVFQKPSTSPIVAETTLQTDSVPNATDKAEVLATDSLQQRAISQPEAKPKAQRHRATPAPPRYLLARQTQKAKTAKPNPDEQARQQAERELEAQLQQAELMQAYTEIIVNDFSDKQVEKAIQHLATIDPEEY